MTHTAKGPFEVKLTAQKPDSPQAEASGHGRMSIEKQFHGDLEGTSQGEMLSVMRFARSAPSSERPRGERDMGVAALGKFEPRWN